MVPFYSWKEYYNDPDKICNSSVSSRRNRSLLTIDGVTKLCGKGHLTKEYRWRNLDEPMLSMCKLKLPWDFRIK